jgi:predicted 3-demethylubiquinone-9 3-methyltransferase (glyoxalase superfamily)
MPAIVPNLWFDTEAEEAAAFYTSIFPRSRIVEVVRYTEAGPGPAGEVVTATFELDGQRFVAINGGTPMPYTEALSLEIVCHDQEEVDHYWDRLLDGGEASQCGWLKDRYGVSWQVVPAELGELFADPDRERADRVMRAMLGMAKLDIAALRRAADAVPA